MKMKKIVSGLLVISLLAGCSKETTSTSKNITSSQSRPMLLEKIEEDYNIKANVDNDYVIKEDLSNVINGQSFNYYGDEWKQKLIENYFVVSDAYNDEFFDLYENNKYSYIPSFVTTDSLLHTFHLYYAYLQKGLEKTTLYNSLMDFSQNMYAQSLEQLDSVRSTPWESAAQRNVDFYAVGLSLLGQQPSMLSQNAVQELSLIESAQGIGVSPIFTTNDNTYEQDYSQFTVRGYYTESAALENYFKTMMWYGQMTFVQKDDDLNRSALLSMLALDQTSKEEWETIYVITSFFAGESDDTGYYEYMPVIEEIYGKDVDVSSLVDDEKGWNAYKEATKNLPAPKINGMVVYEDEDVQETTSGCRILGQRFTFDASILQQLVYRNVEKSENGDARMLPSALDVPAAMGSEVAYEILEDSGVNEYPNYEDQMEKVQDTLEDLDDDAWYASVYSAWLDTLKPLLEEKDESYPIYMQSEEWEKKNLSTFLGSYTELKHDSVLYAKQIMAQMGGAGMDEKPDDRGYVECEPEVFGNIKNLTNSMIHGLEKFNALSSEDKEYLEYLAQLAEKLQVIATKELNGELPTDEEFDLIRSYGDHLEHLWTRTVDDGTKDYYRSMDHPSALITDIATDPNGSCLEIATGKPSIIYVAVNFDGETRICMGTVYSYYEFTQPISNRLTDEQWRSMLDNFDNQPQHPSWTTYYEKTY
ncbi:DUF3160 domain-containing protein [Floccifex sp.]|uniref:DUF3160 domain-containing protein n=1 Tax=Floccifex sp. TaxID=2815810 RepID=UPI003F073741